MWARHRPDVTYHDLGFAWRTLLGRQSPLDTLDAAIVRDWFPAEQAIVCLSVRSGFDLLLRALAPRPGDEVLFSDVTIRAMVRIAGEAGYAARGVAVERASLAVGPEAVEAAITQQTRAIVVAPLFGGRNQLSGVAEVARRHGVLVVEDAAQAFAGRAFAGSPEADVTMFSFGMIKRSTAAGGAVLRVRDPALREAIRTHQRAYPLQSRLDYARRLAMLTLLHAASGRRVYGAIYRLLAVVGDPDRIVSGMGKTRQRQQTRERLSRRPCAPLRRMMARRVQQAYDPLPLVPPEAHQELGANACGYVAVIPPGWVLPATFRRPERVVRRLRRLGYDASSLSSLIRVGTGDDPDHWLAKTLFLPTDRAMDATERSRMIQAALHAELEPD